MALLLGSAAAERVGWGAEVDGAGGRVSRGAGVCVRLGGGDVKGGKCKLEFGRRRRWAVAVQLTRGSTARALEDSSLCRRGPRRRCRRWHYSWDDEGDGRGRGKGVCVYGGDQGGGWGSRCQRLEWLVDWGSTNRGLSEGRAGWAGSGQKVRERREVLIWQVNWEEAGRAKTPNICSARDNRKSINV